MALIGSLPRAVGAGRKLSVVQATVNGTGTVATGLVALDTGGQVCSAAASGTTTPWAVATISSKSAGSVSIVNLALGSGPTIAASANLAVNIIATGN